MAEYVELEVAVKAFNNFDAGRADSPPFTLLTPEEFVEYLYELPTAAVAPVVRCMKCKYLVAVNVNGKGIPTCQLRGMEVAPDEFCSRGEKI